MQKFNTFEWETQTSSNTPKSKDQKILELEQKIKLLEKQKSLLKKQVERSGKKAVFFDMMITMQKKNLIFLSEKTPSRAIDRFIREEEETKFYLWIAQDKQTSLL